jgi:hypothetical protein
MRDNSGRPARGPPLARAPRPRRLADSTSVALSERHAALAGWRGQEAVTTGAERILTGFRNPGVTVPLPFSDTAALFAAQTLDPHLPSG